MRDTLLISSNFYHVQGFDRRQLSQLRETSFVITSIDGIQEKI